MIVYATNITPRLEFVVRVLSLHLGINFELSHELVREDENQPFINYSDKNIGNGLWILPNGLLDETGIREGDVAVLEKMIFPSSQEGAYPFDIFAAVFYMLSRYEEYAPFKGDAHGRFSASESMASRLESLKIPFVDDWVRAFSDELKRRFYVYADYPYYRYIPTVDVDIAFAYRHRPLWLTLAHYAKDLVNRDFNKISNRFRVNVGLDEDPYNTFSFLKENYQYNDAHVFFQVGNRGEYDKNISPWHPEMKKLIFNCSQWANVGLHPSYQSNSDIHVLFAEKKILDGILRNPTVLNRQHFLKMSFPDTYQNLLKAGFTSDFTMGFADAIGFRAGSAHPFPFYDLENECMTELMIYPLAIMDGSLKDYMGLTPEEAKKEISEIISEVKRVKGVFVSLWHNTSLSEIENWVEWLDVFKHMHKEARG